MEENKAVALQYNPGDPSAPTIVASGTGSLAREILDIAFANGVKVREDPDLVEILATLEVGDAIPIVAFAAVAEILSHVYRWEYREQEAQKQHWSEALASET